MKSKDVNTNTCLHYIIQPMRGPVQSFDDLSKICLQCHRRLTDDEVEAVKREIEHIRMIVKW